MTADRLAGFLLEDNPDADSERVLLLATLYIQSDEYKTIPVGLLAFTGKYSTDYPMLFAALSIVTIPMVAIYVIFHRQVINGITEGTLR